jgi:hypothetical protein
MKFVVRFTTWKMFDSEGLRTKMKFVVQGTMNLDDEISLRGAKNCDEICCTSFMNWDEVCYDRPNELQ